MVSLIAMRWWHIPAVTELEGELFGDEAWTPELFWSELANRAGRYYLVALDSGDPQPVGYGGLAAQEADAYIQTLGVASTSQRTGIGRRLMEALLLEAVRRGAQTCWLEVRTDNVAAQQLYRSMGFTERGLRRGYYQPSGADALVMATALTVRTEGVR
jgi:ribosomal-protein-alanine N-acetyltransferase